MFLHRSLRQKKRARKGKTSKTTAEIHAEAIAYVNRKAKLNKDLADNYKQKTSTVNDYRGFCAPTWT